MLFRRKNVAVKRKLGPSLIELLRHELSFLRKVEESNRSYIMGLKKAAVRAEKLVEDRKKRASAELKRLETEKGGETENKIKRMRTNSKRKIKNMIDNFDEKGAVLSDLLEEIINAVELV